MTSPDRESMAISRRMLLRLGAIGLGGAGATPGRSPPDPPRRPGLGGADRPQPATAEPREPDAGARSSADAQRRVLRPQPFRGAGGRPVAVGGRGRRPGGPALRLTLDGWAVSSRRRRRRCSSAPATAGGCTGRGCRACPGSGVPSGRRNGRGSAWPSCSTRAGVQPGAAHLHFLGGDAPPSPKTRGLRAQHPDRSAPATRATILALRMNGEPLPASTAGRCGWSSPAGRATTGSSGSARIVVARDEAPGFFMQTGYRMPRTPVPPGAAEAVPAVPSPG